MSAIANFYAFRIMDGKTTFAKIPAMLQDEVRAILTECGRADLAA